MRVATKLGLAEFFEKEAADSQRFLDSGHPGSTLPKARERLIQHAHNCRCAAHALRHMTTEQEIDFLEFQFGGPDGIGTDSYPNPITVLRPPPPEPVLTLWQKIKKALRTEPMYAYGHGTQ